MGFWRNRKVLVSGGAGFVGSHMVEALLEKAAVVTVADNLERGSRRNIEDVMSHIQFAECDLRDPRTSAEVVRGHDTILNLAAKVAGVTYNRGHHSEPLTDNLLINSSLLRAAATTNAERFLVVSSSAVYPYDSRLPMSEHEAERRAFGPDEEGYSWSKYVSELQGKYCAAETSMRVAIVRPFNLYGPRDPIDGLKAHVIPTIINKVLQGGEELTVAGSGRQTRAFLHVRDAAEAILRVVEGHAEADPVNIGSTREVSIGELTEMILATVGRRMRVFYDGSLPVGNPRKLPDMTKFVQLFGAPPEKISLEQGLDETVSWYRKQAC